jgi:hypothetical protein
LGLGSREPFKLENDEKALLCARYLVEDNTEEYVELNDNTMLSFDIFKSILKAFLQNYKI